MVRDQCWPLPPERPRFPSRKAGTGGPSAATVARKKRRSAAKQRATVSSSHPEYFGLKVNPTVRNVLGDTVDAVLAKRLITQGEPLRDLILAKGERDTGNRIPEKCLARKKETVKRTNVLWRKMLLPPSLRRLPEETSGTFDLRVIRDARIWLKGLVAFRIEDFWLPTLQFYVGKMTESSLTFVRTPPRWVVQRFISAVLRGQVRYISIYGPARRGNLSDPLLQRASVCSSRVIRIQPVRAAKQKQSVRLFKDPKPEYNLRILGQEAQLLALLCATTGQIL